MHAWCAQPFTIIFKENHIIRIKNKASVGKDYLIICAVFKALS